MFGGVGVTFVTGVVTTEAMKKFNEIKRVTTVTSVTIGFAIVYTRSLFFKNNEQRISLLYISLLVVTVVTLVTALI